MLNTIRKAMDAIPDTNTQNEWMIGVYRKLHAGELRQLGRDIVGLAKRVNAAINPVARARVQVDLVDLGLVLESEGTAEACEKMYSELFRDPETTHRLLEQQDATKQQYIQGPPGITGRYKGPNAYFFSGLKKKR